MICTIKLLLNTFYPVGTSMKYIGGQTLDIQNSNGIKKNADDCDDRFLLNIRLSLSLLLRFYMGQLKKTI